LNLVRRYADYPVPYPALKPVSVALWALESGWGRSDLARIHFNFAGIAWWEELADFAAPIQYTAQSTGVTSDYCRFASFENFFDAFWQRFERDPRFADLAANAGSPAAFLGYIAPILRPGVPGYADSVLKILARLEGAQPGGSGAAVSIPDSGFVLRITRLRCERRGSLRPRTIGRYEAFYNGNKIENLEGTSVETHGPGDNTGKGRRWKRRVEAKTYPLYTHRGSRTLPLPGGGRKTAFVTHGYTSDQHPRVPSMPSIRLGQTGARTGILIHPAERYVWSIGCLNLAAALSGPNADINYKDSRARVIALIEAMQSKLGGSFPEVNNQRIPNAKLIIEGEPRFGGAGEEADAPGIAFVCDAENDEAIFDLVAATMNALVSPSLISYARFAQLVAQRAGILNLRNGLGQNLWFEWASGYEEAMNLVNAVERNRVFGELEKIANDLIKAGVEPNDTSGQYTALTAAAAFNEAHAVEALHKFGAQLDLHDRLGNTPLAAAAFHGAVDAVKRLLSLGADRKTTTAECDVLTFEVSFDESSEKPPMQEEAESCPPAATPLTCAQAGRELCDDDAERESAYNEIIDLLSCG
jgi:hypothetical protein